jgi:hypothetical protein
MSEGGKKIKIKYFKSFSKSPVLDVGGFAKQGMNKYSSKHTLIKNIDTLHIGPHMFMPSCGTKDPDYSISDSTKPDLKNPFLCIDTTFYLSLLVLLSSYLCLEPCPPW